MFTHKSLLLLITCILLTFACTSSKKRLAPTQPIGNGNLQLSGVSRSEKMRQLEGKLDRALSKIVTMQGQVGQSDVSQEDLQALQDEITAAQAEIDILEQNAGKGEVSQEDLQTLQDEITAAQAKIDILEKNADEDNDAQQVVDSELPETQTDPTEATPGEGGDAPVISVSLVEIKQDSDEVEKLTFISDSEEKHENRRLAQGMYVTYHSDKDVVIQTIKYGTLTFHPNTITTDKAFVGTVTAFTIQFPIHVGLTYGGSEYCYVTIVDQTYLPKDQQTEGKKVAMRRAVMEKCRT